VIAGVFAGEAVLALLDVFAVGAVADVVAALGVFGVAAPLLIVSR
jgi:hypothetical protein